MIISTRCFPRPRWGCEFRPSGSSKRGQSRAGFQTRRTRPRAEPSIIACKRPASERPRYEEMPISVFTLALLHQGGRAEASADSGLSCCAPMCSSIPLHRL